MAPLWDLIETDFGGDETTVFGPRKETGTALYQVETLASILPSEQSEITSSPHVISTVLGNLACVAVDNLLAVFNDSRFIDTFKFDSTVDALEWSPDGKFLVVGCNSGVLHILDSIKLEILISQSTVTENNRKNDQAFKKIMFNSRTNGLHDLICLVASGQLIVMRNLDLKVSDGGIGEMAKCIFNQIKIIQVDTSPYHTGSTTDVIVVDDKIVTVGSGDLIIVVWSVTGEGLELEDLVSGILNNDAGIISAKATSDKRLFFLLDENHCITLWNVDTLYTVQEWSDLTVSSFQILDSNDNSASDTNRDDLKVVLVTQGCNGHCTLQVLSLPSSTIVYSLQLNSASTITHCLPIQEVVYLVEYFHEQSSQSLSAIRFKLLLETEPETRLYRLIRKQKFEEAEEFARLFKLDIELVHKAKLNIILDQLSPWNASKFESDEIDQLISNMWDSIELITDDLHLVDTCLRAALPTYADTCRLQDWCRSLLENIGKKKQVPNVYDKYQELMTQFYSVQHRFCTYRMAYGSDNYSAGDWDLFMRASLMKEACRALRDEQLDVAFTLWRRHQEEWTKHMKVEMIENILASIPDNLTTSNIYGWLKDDLIPYVSRVVPLALTHVLNWSINKAVNMERFEKDEWPQNALRFLKSVDSCICEETKISLTESTHSAAKSTVNITAAVSKLHNTLTCLQNLHDLKYRYRLCLSLKQFQQETTDSVVFRMLDRVKAMELLPQTLKNQIRPYIAEHKLNENKIFSRYAADHLKRKAISHTGGMSHWEAKLIAVIGYIQDPKEKISAIIDIVMLTPLPLNSEIENLIQSGLEIQHPLVSKLKEHIRKLDIRILISSYSLRNKFVPSKQNAMNLIYFILSKDTPTCVADAVKVMQIYGLKCQAQIHAFRARYLISHNRVQEYLDVLKTLPPQVLVACGRQIIYSQPEVHQPAQDDDQETLELKKMFIYAAVETGRVLDAVVHDNLEREELRNDCKDLQQVLSLQSEYNIVITVAQYRDQKQRELLLFTYVKKTFSRSQKEIHFGKLYRLANLLQISRVRFLSELAIFTARTGHIAAAVKYSRKILECEVSEKHVSALYDVGLCFLQVLGSLENLAPGEVGHLDDLVAALHELAREGSIHAHGTDLLRSMELYKSASLVVDVTRQCENGHSSMEQMELVERFCTLEPMFKEDALVMKTEDVLPIAGNYLVLHPTFTLDVVEEEKADDDRFELSEFCSCCQKVISHFMKHSHMELAFQFLTHVLSSAAMFVSQQFMGYTQHPQLENKLSSLKEHLAAVVEEAKPCEEKLISELFLKSLNSSKVDHKHALLCISSLPRKAAKKMLMNTVGSYMTQHNYKKLKTVSVVGVALGEIHRDPDVIAGCRDLQPQARWGYRLRSLKIDFISALRSGKALKILAQIAPHETVDINIIKEFCQDFSLEEEDGLMVYLEQVLNQGCSHTKVRAAIREIKAQDSLLSKLDALLRECSPYDYEKIHFLLCEIQQLSDTPIVQKNLKILEYIKVYTRRSPPSAYEEKYFEEDSKKEADLSMSFSNRTNETKLPYHLLIYGDPWEIISPELHYDSLPHLISLAKELEIKEDNIYIGAARNMICEYVKAQQTFQTEKKTQSHWHLSSTSLDFLKEVQELLFKVSSVPVALAYTQFAIKELPTGAEKIQALKEGTALAEKWYLLCDENSSEKQKARKAFTKFSLILKQLSTQRILHLHNMAEPDLLALDRSPKELIVKLFEQPAIVEQGWRNEMCDAFEIAEEIAEINDLNLQDIISSLVNKWLPSAESVDDGDSTITFDLSKFNKAEPPSFDDDDNLKRVLYIMKKGCLENNVIYLLSIVFPEKSDGVKISRASQLRALHCLLRLCDNDLLVRVCSKTADSLRHLATVIGYLVELEKLHVVYRVETFEQCNKESLVKGIWRNHSHKKNAVLLVASLCLDHDVHIPAFWEQLLKQFLSLGLLDHLETLLIRLCGVPATWTAPSFGKAWQTFLYNALNKYCPPLTECQEEMCVHYFNILHRCPVIIRVDMQSLADQYSRLGLPTCAACCLVLQADQDVKKYLDGDKLHLLQQLSSLTKMGLNTAIAQQVEGAIFDLIDDQQEYLLILGSAYKECFVQHLIQHNSIHHLVEFAVKHKRMKEAASLVSLYCSYYACFEERLSDYMDRHRCDSQLEAFLACKELVV